MGSTRAKAEATASASASTPDQSLVLHRLALDGDILELNLEPVTHLVAMEQPWPLQKLDEVELEYRCFLQLVRDYPDEPIVPSRDCDLYWHAHILTLGLYLEQCERLFGSPLLHYPFSGAFGPEDLACQQDRFQKCRRLFAELVTRVRRTRIVNTEGEPHEPDILEVPEPGGHTRAAQGA